MDPRRPGRHHRPSGECHPSLLGPVERPTVGRQRHVKTTTMSTAEAPDTVEPTRSYRRSIITAPREVRFDEVPLLEPGPTQVLVRVAAAALCTWEQRVFAGIDNWSYPLVGGHEFSGDVVAI